MIFISNLSSTWIEEKQLKAIEPSGNLQNLVNGIRKLGLTNETVAT